MGVPRTTRTTRTTRIIGTTDLTIATTRWYDLGTRAAAYPTHRVVSWPGRGTRRPGLAAMRSQGGRMPGPQSDQPNTARRGLGRSAREVGKPLQRLWWPAAVAAFSLLAGVSLAGAQRAAESAHPVYYVETRQKAMALTFDVSWGDKMLPKVLAVLQAEHQQATFFVSGPWAQTHPDLVKAILAGGNELASHGQAHVDLGGRSASAIADNLAAADTILRTYTGSTALRFFRPPNGDWSGRVVETARGLGYETIIWSIDSLDWKNPGINVIVRRVVSGAFPGAIILLHASDTCRQTDLALPSIIQDLRRGGWRLVTLGQLWAMGPAVRRDPRGSGVRPNWPPVEGASSAGTAPSSMAPGRNAAPRAAPGSPPVPAVSSGGAAA